MIVRGIFSCNDELVVILMFSYLFVDLSFWFFILVVVGCINEVFIEFDKSVEKFERWFFVYWFYFFSLCLVNRYGIKLERGDMDFGWWR